MLNNYLWNTTNFQQDYFSDLNDSLNKFEISLEDDNGFFKGIDRIFQELSEKWELLDYAFDDVLVYTPKKLPKRRRKIAYRKKAFRDIAPSRFTDNIYSKSNYFIIFKEGKDQKLYTQRHYESRTRKHCKKQTNKKVRQYFNMRNHNHYRKVFDYWWTIY